MFYNHLSAAHSALLKAALQRSQQQFGAASSSVAQHANPVPSTSGGCLWLPRRPRSSTAPGVVQHQRAVSTSGAVLGNFRLIAETEAHDGAVPVRVYRSDRTGLTAAVAVKKGPIVSGRFALATRAFGDDGLPHALEHLTFAGSERYPWRGTLLNLISRSNGSNETSATCVDYTCFGLRTAGSAGFSNLIPVYLDHILHPTLTEAAYLTEVHHITGEGHHGGVVYSELQSSRSRLQQLGVDLDLELRRSLYPGGSGYGFDPSGTVEGLVQSASLEKVERYHSRFYRPENLWCMVVGDVEDARILDTLLGAEEDGVVSSARRFDEGAAQDTFISPWHGELEPLVSGRKEIAIPWPESGEFRGNQPALSVAVAWRGPSLREEKKKFAAFLALLQYLTYPSSSNPLHKALVTGEFAQKLSFCVFPYATSSFGLVFERVNAGAVNRMLDILWKTLRDDLTSVSNSAVSFDLSRMKTILEQNMRHARLLRESDPHSSITTGLILSMLYGRCQQQHLLQGERGRNEPLSEDLNLLLNLEEHNAVLVDKDVHFWRGLLDEYLREDLPSAVLRPVKEAAEERNRVDVYMQGAGDQQQARPKRVILEELRLRKKQGMRLKAALAENQAQPDDNYWQKLLNSFPLPNPVDIKFHAVSSHANFDFGDDVGVGGGGCCQFGNSLNLDSVPVRMRLDDIKASEFAQLTLLVDTSDLEPELRLCLPLYLKKLVTRVPALRIPPAGGSHRHGGQQQWMDTVDDELARSMIREDSEGNQCVPRVLVGHKMERDVVELTSLPGLGSFNDLVGVSLKVETEKYSEGVKWLRDLLFFVSLDPMTVLQTAREMGEEIATTELHRPEFVLSALIEEMTCARGSNSWAAGPIRQIRFLGLAFDQIQDLIKEGKSLDEAYEHGAILQSWKKLQRFMREDPSRLFFHVAVDMDRLQRGSADERGPDVKQPWMDHVVSSLSPAGRVIRTPAEEEWERSGVGAVRRAAGAEATIAQQQQRANCWALSSARDVGVELDLPGLRYGENLRAKRGSAIGMRGVESSHLCQVAHSNVASCKHPDFLPLMLFVEYLRQMEGPLFKAIRGTGLAYGYDLRLSYDDGQVILTLGPTSRLATSYQTTMEVLKAHLVDDAVDGLVEPGLLDAAKGSLVYRIASSEHTNPDLTQLALLSTFRRVPVDYFRMLVARIPDLTAGEIFQAGRRHLRALVDEETSHCAIVCPDVDLAATVDAFHKLGRKIVSFDSVWTSILNRT